MLWLSKLAKDIKGLDNVQTGTVTADKATIGGKVEISKDGVNMGDTKITGLRAGEADTDAVTVAQLNAVKGMIANTSNDVLEKRVSNVEGRVTNLERGLNKLQKESRAGIAGAAAIGNLPQATSLAKV